MQRFFHSAKACEGNDSYSVFFEYFLCVRQVCSTVQIHLFKHLISASDTKKEHLNDRVENSVRWTVMCSKKGFSAENPPLLSLHGINDAINQIIHFRFIIIIQGTDHGYFRIQNTHLLHLIIQEVLHEGQGFLCP